MFDCNGYQRGKQVYNYLPTPLVKNPDTAFLPYLDLLFINIAQNQYPCKQLILLSVYLIFVVLKIMENTIYINQIINYPIQHKISMSCKINSSIS